MSSKFYLGGRLLVLALILSGCFWSLDDKYLYVDSYRICNKTSTLKRGRLILDSTYYKPAYVLFEIHPDQIKELFTEDGGNGPDPIRTQLVGELSVKKVKVEYVGVEYSIDVEHIDKWEFRSEGSTGVYVFNITDEVFASPD